MRAILALLVMINASAALWASQPGVSGETEQETAAVKEEISNDAKKNGGVIPFDKLAGIWDKVSNLVSKQTEGGHKLFDLLTKKLPMINSLIQSKVGIKNVVIEPGPAEFRNSFDFKGTVVAPGGMQVNISLLHVPLYAGSKKGGNILTFSFPPGTPIDKIIPGLNTKALGSVTISQLNCTLSDFEYTDPISFHPIVKGLNIFVGIDPSAMKIFSADKLKDIIDFQGGNILGVATMTKTPEEEVAAGKSAVATSFKVIIPPNMIKIKKFKLSQLTDLLNIPIPEKIKSELSRVEIDQLDVTMDFTPNYQLFDMSGVVDLFGVKNVRTQYKIYKADKSSTDKSTEPTVLVNEVLIEMPDSWSIAQQVPELQMLKSVTAKDQRLLLVSRAHHDVMTGMDVPAGVSYSGTIELAKLGEIPVVQGLSKVFGNQVKLRGTLAPKLADSQFEVILEGVGEAPKLTLADLVPPAFSAGKQILSKVSLPIKDLHIKFGGSNTRQVPSAPGVSTPEVASVDTGDLDIPDLSVADVASIEAPAPAPAASAPAPSSAPAASGAQAPTPSKGSSSITRAKSKLSGALANLRVTAKANFKLESLASLMNLPIPEKIKSELSRVGIDSINIIPGDQSFAIEAIVSMFGASNVKIRYEIYTADRSSSDKSPEATVLVNKLLIEMPNSWNIGKQIPELKVLTPLTASFQEFIFVSRAHRDPIVGIDVPAGVSYAGIIHLDKLGDNAILRTLGKVLGENVIIRGTLAPNLADSKFEATIGAGRTKEAKMTLGELVPSNFVTAKRDLSKVTLSLGTVTMSVSNAGESRSINATGTGYYSNVQMPTRIRAVYQDGSWKSDIIMTMQQKVPGIEAVNQLKNLALTSITIAIIQDSYTDPVTGVTYEEGLNIGGYLGFTGAMSFVDKLFHIKGLNINGTIQDLGTFSPNIRFTASLPGDASISFSKGVKMSKMHVFIDIGFPSAVGIQGSVSIPVPKEFRPKKGTPSHPMSTTALDMNRILQDDLLFDLSTEMPSSTLATSMDTEASDVEEMHPAGTSAAADESGDIVIEEEPAPTEAPDLTPFEGELTSPMQGAPEPEFVDQDMDLSGYAEPVGDNSILNVDGSLAVSGEAGVMSCQMNGAIDIKGLVLENVAFEGQMAMTVPPIPTGLAFRADLQLTHAAKPKVINFAAKMAVGSTTTSYAWSGSYKGGLYLSDLVGLAFNITKRAPGETQQFRKEFFNAMKKVPKIGIDELTMMVVPVPTTIVNKLYEEGTTADIKFVLLGARGQATAHLDYSGINGKGSLSKVSYPKSNPLFILSSFDRAAGPSVSFNVGKGKGSMLNNDFTVDGNMEIKPLGFKSAVTLQLSLSEATFHAVEKMFGVYQSDVEGTMNLGNLKATHIKATFKQDALAKFSELLRGTSRLVLLESKKTLDKARNDILNEFDGKIAEQRAIVRKEREKATGSISNADKAAKDAINKEIDKAKKKLSDLHNRLNKHKKECKKAKVNSCLAIVGDGVEIAAQETYVNALLKPAKAVAHGTLDAAKGTVNLAPIDSDPRVSALIVAKETALAGIKAGTWGSKATAELTNALATAADKALNIKSVEIDVKLDELLKGKLPKVSIEGVILSKKIRVKQAALDLKNPADLKKLVTTIINSL